MRAEKLAGRRLCSSCAKHFPDCVELTMGKFVTSPKGIFCEQCRTELHHLIQGTLETHDR